MNKLIFLSSALLCIALFTQCAGTSKASEEKSESAKTFEAPSDRGSVYLYRTGRLVGAGVSTPVKVNGQDAGGIGFSTFSRWLP